MRFVFQCLRYAHLMIVKQAWSKQRQRWHEKVLLMLKRPCNEKINYIKNKMTPLMLEESKSHLNKRNCCIRQKEIGDDNDINQRNVRDYCHYTNKYRSAFWREKFRSADEYAVFYSFHFAEEIWQQDPNLHMASLDVDTLFTNIPLT